MPCCSAQARMVSRTEKVPGMMSCPSTKRPGDGQVKTITRLSTGRAAPASHSRWKAPGREGEREEEGPGDDARPAAEPAGGWQGETVHPAAAGRGAAGEPLAMEAAARQPVGKAVGEAMHNQQRFGAAPSCRSPRM